MNTIYPVAKMGGDGWWVFKSVAHGTFYIIHWRVVTHIKAAHEIFFLSLLSEYEPKARLLAFLIFFSHDPKYLKIYVWNILYYGHIFIPNFSTLREISHSSSLPQYICLSQAKWPVEDAYSLMSRIWEYVKIYGKRDFICTNKFMDLKTGESAAFLHYYNFVCVVTIKRFCKQISKIIGKGARV